LIINRYGRGQVIYLPEALGHFYGTAGLPGAEDRIANCVNYLTGEPVIEVSAPTTVSIEAYRQKKNDRIIIHLVNNTADACLAGERFSVAGIDLSLSIYRDPKAVSPLREKGNTSYEITENKLKIHVSSLKVYEVISIDL
ncbi:MAG: hypothetical protein PHT33_12395, partial [bacterium]|nr:hypothetical protein [bacterium]